MDRVYLKYYKRLLDVALSGLLILIAAPVFLVISLMLWVVNRGSIFFKQERPGLNEEPFRILKFKRMHDAWNSEGRRLPDIQRITKVGRWLRKLSLDELPHLWNVFKGAMSIIGPRPLLCKYIPLYSKRQRHEVKSGITGWARVNGRNAISWEKKIELDLYYNEHLSFILDIKIIWLSVIKILKREGINQSELQPMRPFGGTVK